MDKNGVCKIHRLVNKGIILLHIGKELIQFPLHLLPIVLPILKKDLAENR